MTVSGPAGSPESDGVLPTRRQARALREAADAAVTAETPAVAAPVPTEDDSAVPVPTEDDSAVPVSTEDDSAVPVPPVPVSLVSPDLSVVVESLSASPTSEPRRLALTSRRAPAALASSRRAPTTPPTRSTVRRPNLRKPIAKIVTLLAIPAVFLTAALPAYAFSPDGEVGGASVQAAGETQALTVAAAATAVSISTDGFTATSQAELDDIQAEQVASAAKKRASENSRSSVADFAVYGVRAEGDDYPWPAATTDSQGGGLSPLGYYYRECVDFVAWRLNRDAGSTAAPWKLTWSTMTPGGGDGSSWAGAWAAKGWPTSTTPVVGAVATFSYNHVAYVQSVPGDGTVVLEEYNWMGSHAYHTRTVPISEVRQFLYPPS